MTRIAEGFIPRASVVVGLGGAVVPPPSVVAALQQISPRLGLRWMTGAHVPYWALTQRWAEGDPRWQQVQAGRIAESAAFDIAHIFPLDVSVADMASYVETRWSETAHRQTGGQAASSANRAVDEARSDTAKVQSDAVARATSQSLERHERESRHDLRVAAGVDRPSPQVTFGKGFRRRTA